MLTAISILFLVQTSPSEQLQRIAQADQADRQDWEHMTGQRLEEVSKRDKERRQQVWELLKKNVLTTGKDYDAAALIFQHGEEPEDYETARELSILGWRLGRYGSLVALAEDRFLDTIGRKQRFGSQFGPNATAVDDSPPVVPDSLRLDFLVPKLSERNKTSKGLEDAVPRLEARLRSPAAPLAELSSLKSGPGSRARVCRLVQSDSLKAPMDYYNAARVLSEGEGNELLLANELATYGACMKVPGAFRLFCETWDAYKKATGLKPRYVPATAPSVCPAVKKLLSEDRAAPPPGNPRP